MKMDIQVKLCLQEIVKLDLEVQALIQDIRECAVTTDILEDLDTEAREKLNRLRRKVEELERLGKEQDNVEDILKDVENHRQRLLNTTTSLRKTKLAAQLNIEKQEKEQLLSGGVKVRKRNVNNKEGLAKTSEHITESLMSLNRTLAGQVQQSGHTKSTLITTSKTVTETHEELKGMGGHIQNSRSLLTKYSRRNLTDKLLIFLALVFFFATVLYIVKKRIWS